MTTTDPRIEAATRALTRLVVPEETAKEIEALKDLRWDAFTDDAVTMLAAADAVDPLRQPGHRVEIEQYSWTLQHPAECRPNMLTCQMTRTLQRLGASGIDDGTYAIELTDDGSLFFPDEVDQ